MAGGVLEELKKLRRGDFVFVWWLDASEMRGTLNEHESPEVHVCDWGIFLGIMGREKRHVVLSSSLVEEDKSWGATRIPIDLIVKVDCAWSRDEVQKHLEEVKNLRRRVYIRRYKVQFYRLSREDVDALK